MNCVCQNGPQRPGVQEVIDTLQRGSVCTGTQCFETQADAFGLQAPPQQDDSSTMFMMLMAYARATTRPPSPPGGGVCSLA